MIAYPNAKVNLGLYITEKRSDGYHNIETIFVPIPKLCDIIEIMPMPKQDQAVAFTRSGISIDGDLSHNLCMKAYNLINERVNLPRLAIHLHKQIPIGAGLGGGSSNGAFTLNMLNQLADKPLTSHQLKTIALELGSDCPFFLLNKPCFASGRGENLEPLDIKLNGYYMVLINPKIHVNTGFAYSQCKPLPAPCNLRIIENIPIEKWNSLVTNDFEKIVFPIHPKVASVKDELYSLGAVYSSMSGSGSSVFGIFRELPEIEGRFKDFFIHISQL
jgi:4-diphosphocytidyl-2-C-methyl-D-erythritol kinase